MDTQKVPARVKLYINSINLGLITIEDVPSRYQDQVKEYLGIE